MYAIKSCSSKRHNLNYLLFNFMNDLFNESWYIQRMNRLNHISLPSGIGQFLPMVRVSIVLPWANFVCGRIQRWPFASLQNTGCDRVGYFCRDTIITEKFDTNTVMFCTNTAIFNLVQTNSE